MASDKSVETGAWERLIRDASDSNLSILACALTKPLETRLAELEETMAVVLRRMRVLAERQVHGGRDVHE